MGADQMRELLYSLAWYDCSAFHNANVHAILGTCFPGADFSADLHSFVEASRMPPGEGCPR